ncbi:type II toxin-antitoxin system HipA family toxin [Conexibacter woesei]|uniref:type II toxin-antitoxin system HipA family toxin n=1 Tax=Conexibacter woesei TaxID=191495 RepID=UPI0004154880|nr:HipA domain-containing protein [Conexibacter woesei]
MSPTRAEVWLWGTRIGAVVLPDGGQHATFAYDPDFVPSGIQLAPLMMPLRTDPYSFPALAPESFHGLPGMLADALPDRYGNVLIDAWLAEQGRRPESFNAVERLCYTGSRGMGALEFRPAAGPDRGASTAIDITALVQLASEVLSDRKRLSASFDGESREDAMRDILRVGTSAGGARAKAVIAWNPETGAVRSGQAAVPPGFEHWLLKFDGVAENRDRELADPKGYGLVEYAYAKLAARAGITMSECRIMAEHDRHHFMTRRFDRTADGDKLHLQSLAALRHFDFRSPAAYSYEQALLMIRELGLGQATIEEQFRRMVFNVVARNQDDHVKNIAFLMDRAGQWSLSPAFDVMWAFNPTGDWTSQHQMSLNGKRDGFALADLDAVASTAAMRRGRAAEIHAEVREAVAAWPEVAAEVGVPDAMSARIAQTHRLALAPG